MKKFIFILIFALLGYNSVYFKKLSELKVDKNSNFDFNAFADSLYYKGIQINNQTIELTELLTKVQEDQTSSFIKFGNRLGIGNSAYFMVKCKGEISNIENGTIKILIENNKSISIDTKFIFGNAIRDASGLVKITDFKTNEDFNKVSEALNSIIREKVMPPIVQKLTIGDVITVDGAVKLSKKEVLNLEILPVNIKMAAE